jgi:hypothetical protein
MPGFPHIAVVLDDNNEVVTATFVPTAKAGEALIEHAFAKFKADKLAGKI